MADTNPGYDLALPADQSQNAGYKYSTKRADGKTVTITADHALSQDEVRQAFRHFGAELSLPEDTSSVRKPPAQRLFTPIESATHLPFELKRLPPDSTAAQFVRGTTATLPVMGGWGGGVIGTPAGPIGAAAGVGGGSMAGEQLRQLLNNYLVGDRASALAPITAGAANTATAGAAEALPGVVAGLSPSAIASDVEGGTSITGLPGKALSRFVRAVRPPPGPILSRPPWQSAEAPPTPDFDIQPVTDAERAAAGSLGRNITVEPPATNAAGSQQPDAWDRMLDEARKARQSQSASAPPILRKAGNAPPSTPASSPAVADSIQSALENAGKPTSAPVSTAAPGRTLTPAGKPSVTAQEYDQIATPQNASSAQATAQANREMAAKAASEKAARAAKRTTGGLPDTAKTPSTTAPGGPAANAAAEAEAAAENKGSVGERATRIVTKQNKPAPAAGSNQATTQALNEDLARLGREYGAGRIGKAMRPDAPEVGTGAVVNAKIAAGDSGKSAMPDVAQRALLRDLQSGQLNNPSKTLRALSQLLKEYSRNGGPADSDTARQVEQLLAKHGFNTGRD